MVTHIDSEKSSSPTKIRSFSYEDDAGKVRKSIVSCISPEHPKAEAFMEWLRQYNNLEWYKTHKDYVYLVPNGIMMYGEVINLKDETVKNVDGKNTWQYLDNTLFLGDFVADFYEKDLIPDFEMYKILLPGNDKNKINFFNRVLGLSFSGQRNPIKQKMIDNGVIGGYWTKTRGEENFPSVLVFHREPDNISINLTTNEQAFALRLLQVPSSSTLQKV